MISRTLLLLLLVVVSTGTKASDGFIQRHADAVPRAQCFPIEKLNAEDQQRSRELLLQALDSEALYTIVGHLKPVSEGFYQTFYDIDPADAKPLADARRAMAVWESGGWYETGVLPFQSARGGRRFAAAWVANRSDLTRKLTEQSAFFEQLGMTAESSAEAVMLRIEGARQQGERWRGFGLIFGYPESAVDFFVEAGLHYSQTGEFVERDFRNYPTHARSSGNFVYAVPRLQKENADEKKLRRQVEAILNQYRIYREKHIVDDDPRHVTDLIRDWFDDGDGWCHPSHALQKVKTWSTARDWVVKEAVRLKTVDPAQPLDDLQSLNSQFKAARIIGLGESTHGTREFFQLKHRIFRHMVKNHGVRLFGIEASYAACLRIDYYIQTGEGDPKDAIHGQGFWTWDTEEVLALVEWMREWNVNRPQDSAPLRFYGFDTQDADTPLRHLLEQLKETNADQASRFRERMQLALQGQYSDALNSASAEKLQELLLAIQDLRTVVLPQKPAAQEQQGTAELLLLQAESAIQIDLARQERDSDYATRPKNVRDSTMASFVTSLLKQHGSESRIVLWAHDWHISRFDGSENNLVPRMGTFLEREYGPAYLPVGFSFGSGSFQAKYFPAEGEDPSRGVLREFTVRDSRPDSFSQIFDEVDVPVFALNLADTPLPEWLRQRHPNRTIGAVYDPSMERSDSYYEQVILPKHFELILHVSRTNRAVPLKPVPRFRLGAKFSEGELSGEEAKLTGAVVETVASESLAAKSGLKPGDRIVTLEGATVRNAEDFQRQLAEISRGGSHYLEVLRKGSDGAEKRLEFYLTVPSWVADQP